MTASHPRGALVEGAADRHLRNEVICWRMVLPGQTSEPGLNMSRNSPQMTYCHLEKASYKGIELMSR
jgi:hypothetical protein